ncbi:FKBP-type peptidyl-prolyl cis-trans isomerase [Pelagicoccus sp. SDUM812005]|uniref:FKBP-type peptidyl-prolyl cis-trans isomerase n=1 Tax=Pelagicoccus sp. SDUM812005 TaxID=3041257 RepID=UPI0028109C53|nr:FKBP-type peptidyl-prolyl cis-trans isomerase [Pelagicoccus sp. SDUM812005]MDQ8182670.1 FKBP-type peptidyl-prolyl cis-trans isomerase [Pelagicoccus sp. SDUM812005]
MVSSTMLRRLQSFFHPLLVFTLLFASTYSLHARPASKRALEKAFLESNANRPGVVTTKSGLQYEALQKGTGTEYPKRRDTVIVHLEGKLTDGTVFESTLHRPKPVEIPISKLVSGCREAIRLMNVGDKYRFYLPSKLGYGGSQQGDIPPYSVLIFEIELFEIVNR